MRIIKSLAIAASTLALATGAAFAGEAPLTDQSDPLGYQPYAYSYEQGGRPELLSDAQEYEVYEVYVVPAEIVLIPMDQPSAPSVAGNELG
jgi:hypothetical protein